MISAQSSLALPAKGRVDRTVQLLGDSPHIVDRFGASRQVRQRVLELANRGGMTQVRQRVEPVRQS